MRVREWRRGGTTPASVHDAELARERLALEELLLHQAALVSRRRERELGPVATPLAPRGPEVERWIGFLARRATLKQKTVDALIAASRAALGEG